MLFASLPKRRIHGVDFGVSDDHAGLVEAVARARAVVALPGDLMRTILGHCSMRVREVAPALKAMFSEATRAEAERQRDELVGRFRSKAAAVMKCYEDGFDDAMAVIDLCYQTRALVLFAYVFVTKNI